MPFAFVHQMTALDGCHTRTIRSLVDENDAKETQGQVLVHCAAGISRSPTVVIAYLMYSKRMQMRDAYEFVRSKRSSIAPNFNFLGQLLELNSQLFPSSSPGQSVTGLGEPMPTQQAKHLESHRSGPMDPSCKPPTGLPSPILSASPKHVGTKKRERPTFFSMKVPPYGGSEFARPFGGAHSSQPSPTESHMVGSPSEGKRSRVSLFNPSSAWTTSEQLLPSPCTEISQLHLSSPSDPHRGLAQTLVLQPSMDSLHYEPCSVGGSGETASSILSSTNGRWRRSLTSLGMSGVSPGPIRPTLLAERRVSSQQSAPSTPSRFTSEQLWHRGGLQLNLPSPGSVAPSQTSSVPFTRDYSPIAERSTEPPTEHHELQQCAFQSSPSNSLGAVMNFGLNRLSELPDCQHSGRPTDSSPVLCNLRLSQSAPSCSRSFCWPVGQELSHTANRSDGTTVESPFLVVLQSSILWNPPWSSLTRLRTHALGLELSCRQEETLSQCVPAELCLPCSHIVRSSLSASTGNLCTRTLAAL
ncbi:Dual specificity protein phosphatase Mpk3 [Fasciola hepatica]|uniref:protein-tyrosine-phosphatase n=1 Tax=Fasciola hepatica TaxID=6192 RepID=A0A2H1C782_FASHE|nr:Dual specificity protein phosphatase Mpk3 [Fasciola hepatica]